MKTKIYYLIHKKGHKSDVIDRLQYVNFKLNSV